MTGHFAAWEEPELFATEIRAALNRFANRAPAGGAHQPRVLHIPRGAGPGSRDIKLEEDKGMTAFWRTPAGLHVASARLPVEGELASFDGATEWLNSQPLTPAGPCRPVFPTGPWEPVAPAGPC